MLIQRSEVNERVMNLHVWGNDEDDWLSTLRLVFFVSSTGEIHYLMIFLKVYSLNYSYAFDFNIIDSYCCCLCDLYHCFLFWLETIWFVKNLEIHCECEQTHTHTLTHTHTHTHTHIYIYNLKEYLIIGEDHHCLKVA